MKPLSLCTSRFGLSVGLCVLCGIARAQQGDTLADFLPKLSWDPVKSGTLIAVDVDHVTSKSKSSNLKAFDRKLVVVGKLSAIVPTEMVLIDDDFKEPNLYDGLPMNAKVLYLLSTLTPSQLQIANTTGIGQSDLQGEQIKVLKSIVPQPLAWATILLTGHELQGETLDQGEVPADQIDQVKIRIQSGLIFNLLYQGKPNAYSPVPGSQMYGKAGDTVTIRTKTKQPSAYGVNPRQSYPNKLKPSELKTDMAVFDKVIQVPPQTSIRQLLSQIGEATGLELHADLRVADLQVTAIGSSATARDLLKAVALCVTGTYRKVGSAYDLTSDLIGLGVRKLKFVAWQENVNKEMFAREDSWRRAIATSGAVSKIGFDPKDPLAPDDRTRSALEQVNDKFRGDEVPASELTPGIRDYLGRYVAERPDLGFLLDKVGLHSQIQFSFVLPDGKVLHPEFSDLGRPMSFNMPSSPAKEEPIVTEMFQPNPAVRHPLIVHVESDADAKRAVDLARTHGISELWLETHRKSALLAAQNRGVNVSLVVRPWEAIEGDSGIKLDRNMVGDSGTQLSVRRNAEPDWQQHQKNADLSGRGPAPLYDLIHPLASDLERRWDNLGLLAHTTGLAGVVVLDLQPLGYEATDLHVVYGGYAAWLSVLNEFGYSDAMRLAFLREHSIDPLDLAPHGIFLGFDIEQPFFLDDFLGQFNNGTGFSNRAVGAMYDEWLKYRSTLIERSMKSLFLRVADLNAPILVKPMSTAIHVPPEMGTLALPWSPGQSLPKYDLGNYDFTDPGLVLLYTLNEDSSAVAIRDLAWALKGKGSSVAVDLSSVKINKLQVLLDAWFPKTPDK
jgi:hypothetical protein